MTRRLAFAAADGFSSLAAATFVASLAVTFASGPVLDGAPPTPTPAHGPARR